MMTDEQLDAVRNVASEIVDERKEQHAKWGEQNHPSGTGEGALEHLAAMTTGQTIGRVSRAARGLCEAAVADGSLTYAHIAWEEIAEAFDEDNPTKLRAELVQCAAVFVAWIETIDRRSK